MKLGIALVGLAVTLAGCVTGEGVGGIGDECAPDSRCADDRLDCHEVEGVDYCCNPERVSEYESMGLALDGFVCPAPAEMLTGACFDERDCRGQGPRAACLAGPNDVPFCSRACDETEPCDDGDTCEMTTEGPFCIPAP